MKTLPKGHKNQTFILAQIPLPKGHKNQIFTLAQILGPVQMVMPSSYKVTCPSEEACPESGLKLVWLLGPHKKGPPEPVDSWTGK